MPTTTDTYTHQTTLVQLEKGLFWDWDILDQARIKFTSAQSAELRIYQLCA